MKKKILSIVGGAIVLLLVVVMGNNLSDSDLPVLGSVQQGSEYHSVAFGDMAAGASGQLVTGHGVLGSLVVTGANTGSIDVYNVTTTDIGLRAAALTTSTVLIASFPASLAAGTYTLDINAYQGIFVEVTGDAPTSTLTWR